ncbi:hypothetical protein [Streptomyces shenzhenensis]|uniref:Uncharacterized protein n=1 Tax=Streptomyces shenzhenensis TaxID=943815 RepID=A0A3M0I731_9ACTN|nr:hypothetical protein [Streptomyces shenzhenensis]RMB84118.1 hypothetical protein CTZ28_19530 [Streptomyces shenzhenensis]
MDIRWDNLGEVSLASFGVTIAVVVLFSLAIAAWSRAGGLRGLRGGAAGGGPARVAAGAAVLCFAACLAVAAYGIDLIVPG